MAGKITFRALVEVLGKPKEHVERSMKMYLEKLKNDGHYELIHTEVAPVKEQKEEKMWTQFAELEANVTRLVDLIRFCFEYMPSAIEVIEPKEVQLKDRDLSQFLSDLQLRLHQVDIVAKQLKMKNDHLERNMVNLMKNYITVLLSGREKTIKELGQLTGVDEDKLADLLDPMIDEGKIDLKEGKYFLKR